MLCLLIAFILLGDNHHAHAKQHRTCDLVEWNTCFDRDPDETSFDQIIIWRFQHSTRQYVVTEWFSVKFTDESRATPRNVFVERHSDGSATVTCFTGLSSLDPWYVLKAKQIRFTKTHFSRDPERLNRELLPETSREGILTMR